MVKSAHKTKDDIIYEIKYRMRHPGKTIHHVVIHLPLHMGLLYHKLGKGEQHGSIVSAIKKYLEAVWSRAPLLHHPADEMKKLPIGDDSGIVRYYHSKSEGEHDCGHRFDYIGFDEIKKRCDKSYFDRNVSEDTESVLVPCDYEESTNNVLHKMGAQALFDCDEVIKDYGRPARITNPDNYESSALVELKRHAN